MPDKKSLDQLRREKKQAEAQIAQAQRAPPSAVWERLHRRQGVPWC